MAYVDGCLSPPTTYHIPSTYLLTSGLRRDAASLQIHCDVQAMREAAAGGRHRNCVVARRRAGVGGDSGGAAATTAGDQGCGQQNKEQRPEGQLQSASLCRDEQQEENSKNSSPDGRQPTRTVK